MTTLTYKSRGKFGPNVTKTEHESREAALMHARTILDLDQTAEITLTTEEKVER